MPTPAEELMATLGPLVHRLCRRDPEAARFVAALGRWLASVADRADAPESPADGTSTLSPDPAFIASPISGTTIITQGATLPPAAAFAPSTPPAPSALPASANGSPHVGTPDPSDHHPAPAPPEPRHPATPTIVTKPVALRLGDTEIKLSVAGSDDEIAAANRSVRAPAPPTRDVPLQEPADLPLIARRASLKALSCDAAAAKLDATSPEERDAAKTRVLKLLEERHALQDCFLWMLKPDLGAKAQDLRALRPCFDNLSLAATVATRCLDRKDRAKIEQAIRLLAEAQSALRRAIENAWLDQVDRDQYDAFTWLRTITAAEHFFIERYMRMDDPADPAAHADLHERLVALDVAVRAVDNRGREAAKALKQLRYHAGLIAENPDQEREHDWAKVGGVLEKLGALGVFPGDDRLTESVESLSALAPDRWRLSPAAREVLSAACELAEPEDAPPTKDATRPKSRDMLAVREWLRGKRAVIIGGELYPHAAERIRRTFGLSDLQWLELTEHGKTAPIEPPIAHPDTAIVWLIIGLTGHLHIDVAAECARLYHKPLVRLPAGYNPSQLAHHTLDQASAFFATAGER